jgi:hypothetical protein
MVKELLTLRRKELGSNFQHVIPRSNTPMHIINWHWLLLSCGTTELIGVVKLRVLSLLHCLLCQPSTSRDPGHTFKVALTNTVCCHSP